MRQISVLVVTGLIISALAACGGEPTSVTTKPANPPTATTTAPAPAIQVNTPSSPADPWLIAALILCLLALLAALVGWRVEYLRRLRISRSRYNVPPPLPPPLPPQFAAPRSAGPPVVGDNSAAEHDRDRLADACMEIADLYPDAAMVAQVRSALEKSGYQLIDPSGERFDARLHEALGARPTADASMDNVIAECPRLGYRRGPRVLRTPRVVVWSYRAG
jgi:hypothetical protein